MKKKLLLSIFAFFVTLCFSVNTFADSVEEHFIGNSINVAKASKYGDFVTANNVLDTNYIDNYASIRTSTSQTTTVINSYCYESKTEVYNALNTNYSIEYKTSLNKILDTFSAAVNNKFKVGFETSLDNYLNTIYANYNVKRVNGSEWFDKYNSDTTREEFMNNLDCDYLVDLVRVYNGKLSYNDFFDAYGTHLIVYCELGCNLDIMYEVGTNSLNYSSTLTSNLTGNSGISINKIASIGIDLENSISKKYNMTETNTKTNFSCVQEGGIVFTSITQDTLVENYNEWALNCDKYPTIVNFKNNGEGLIPLYELIPSYIVGSDDELDEFKVDMFKAMDAYIENNSLKIEVTEDALYPDTISSEEISLRSDSVYTITDAGRFVNANKDKYDTIELSNFVGTSLDKINKNYNSCTIDVKFKAKDVDDGYRYLFIYDGISSNSLCLGETIKFETTSNYKQYTKSFTIDLSNGYALPDNLYILYGASGVGDDDWKIGDVYCKLTFNK